MQRLDSESPIWETEPIRSSHEASSCAPRSPPLDGPAGTGRCSEGLCLGNARIVREAKAPAVRPDDFYGAPELKPGPLKVKQRRHATKTVSSAHDVRLEAETFLEFRIIFHSLYTVTFKRVEFRPIQ